jgi:hypothetical protein
MKQKTKKRVRDPLAKAKKAVPPISLARAKATVRRRPPPKKVTSSVFHVLDTKGEVFGEYATREDAWHDAVGPRFCKGFYIVEYAKRGVRRYDYNAASLKEMRDVGR